MQTSAWRTSDLVTYERARESVNELVGLLFGLAREGGLDNDRATQEVTSIRNDILEAGFDRERASRVLAVVESRLSELKGPRP